MADQFYVAVQQCLQQTLNPAVRKQAEEQLANIEKQPGFASILMKLVIDDAVDPTCRFTGAVYFKNFIKRYWDVDDASMDIISSNERLEIKGQIVNLMISAPEKLQLQISDTVSIIAARDFPGEWSNLLPDMVQKLSPTDYVTNNGILRTAHGIFKRWRSETRSNELFMEIKYVLDIFCERYLQLFQYTDELIAQKANDPGALQILLQSLLLLIKIYYDLNCQDLPEFFEDNLATFVALFKKYLQYSNPLVESDDEDEAGPLEKIKCGICEILELHTQRDDEEFTQASEFVSIVFDMLEKCKVTVKYDHLVSRAMTFLGIVVRMERFRYLFESDVTLRTMCEKIAVKNIEMRDVDEELFEDNPIEYIRKDLEGSDTDTRRRAAADFIRNMLEHFEAPVTAIMLEYITHYLQKYNANPASNWKDKDSAVFLFVAVACRSTTVHFGVTKINDHVNAAEFFEKNVLCDLQNDVNAGSPILKVDAIKYLYAFRSKFTKEQLLTVLPLVMKHLKSDNYVVHTYAAITIERVLFLRHGKAPVVTAEDIKQYTETLLSDLFRLIEQGRTPEKLAENDYLMQAVMRVIITSRTDMLPYVDVIMDKLITILGVISANPSNPKFSHFVFESIGALIRFICPVSDQAVSSFENKLFAPFQTILSQDVQEFAPYVFQLMAQLLEQHKGQDLSQEYVNLLEPLLNPSIWQQGNIPALVRLIQAYLSRGINTVLANNKLETVLGIFRQRLIPSKMYDFYGLQLLSTVIETVPFDTLSNYLPAIVGTVLQRLMSKKTGDIYKYDKFTDNFRTWVCLYFMLDRVKGPDKLIEVIESLQQGLFIQLMNLFVLRDLNKIQQPIDAKICMIGLVRLLTHSDMMLREPYLSQLWAAVLSALMTQIDAPQLPADQRDELGELDDAEHEYKTRFSRLSTANPQRVDPTASLPHWPVYLAAQISAMPEAKRAMILPYIQQNPRAIQLLQQ